MNSAAAIIEAINGRAAAPSRLREAARESWRGWFDRRAERQGRVTGAPAQALVDEMALREPALPPGRAAQLTRWQAVATLWRQQWHPSTTDERQWRWIAGGVSFVWHVIVVILLLWITAMRFIPPRQPAADEAVQVEFIGVGTPEEAGGGPAPTAAARTEDESPAQAARAATSAASPPTPASAPPEAVPESTDTPEPSPSPAAAAQPLVVSPPANEEPAPFVLPPTRAPEAVFVPRSADVAGVEAIDIPERRDLAPRPLAQVAPEDARPAPSRPAPVSVEAREIPDPVVLSPRPVTLAAPPVEVPAAARPTAQVADRPIPDRSPQAGPATAPAASAASASSSTADPATRPSSSTAAQGAAPHAAAGPRSAAPSAGVGVGPRPVPTPGAFPTPRRADDWGESTRDRPGGTGGRTAGTGDAWPRLGQPPGSASAGLPPGMVTQEIRDLDRAGTWLRRAPTGYEPTRFDRFWRPNETLLQEWVRRGVKDVGIPIPGTGKRIVCKVSLLALGGACTVTDPDLNEQPATARPPPDVPFKPHLQEGSGLSVPPPSTGD